VRSIWHRITFGFNSGPAARNESRAIRKQSSRGRPLPQWPICGLVDEEWGYRKLSGRTASVSVQAVMWSRQHYTEFQRYVHGRGVARRTDDRVDVEGFMK
jgi:hypothetical protein